jgi:hypothetical protein
LAHPYEFTLDFSVMQPPQASEADDLESDLHVRCDVVARVKIPTTLVFDILRAVNANMTAYERAFGTIRRPGEHEHEQ